MRLARSRVRHYKLHGQTPSVDEDASRGIGGGICSERGFLAVMVIGGVLAVVLGGCGEL